MTQPVWSWLEGVYMWLGGLAGMAAVAYVLLNWQNYAKRNTALSLTMFGASIFGLIVLLSHSTRPHNVVSGVAGAIFGGTLNIGTSPMAVGLLTLPIFILLSLLVLVRNLGVRGLAPLVDSKPFGAVLILVGLVLASYTGFVLVGAMGIPLWNNAALPLLWLINAALCGVAVTKLLVDDERLAVATTRLGLGLIIAYIVALFAFAAAAKYGSKASMLSITKLLGGEYAAAFWGGAVLIGIVVPLIAALINIRRENRIVGVAMGVTLLIGTLILKVLVIQAGVFEII